MRSHAQHLDRTVRRLQHHTTKQVAIASAAHFILYCDRALRFFGSCFPLLYSHIDLASAQSHYIACGAKRPLHEAHPVL